MKPCLVFAFGVMLCCALLVEGGNPFRMLPQYPDGKAESAWMDYSSKCLGKNFDPKKTSPAACAELSGKLCTNPKVRCKPDGSTEILSQGDYVMKIYDKNGNVIKGN